ncbi:MAG TPA: lipid A biosynthesis acyltransferase [Cytophagales bacterium]|jgi:predicted LPLAT superfamily acyltransferase|nr:lipid A biosynthesis acyltransferase [Cytophagales bacterium]
MSQWEGKSRGNKLGYQIFVFVCDKLGAQAAYFLLRFVSFYFFLFSPSSTRQIYLYFRKRHKFTRLKSVVNVYKNYFVFGQTLIDKVILLGGLKNKFTYHFDGVENLQEIVGLGKGGILLSGHVGNWEIASHLLKKLNTKVNVVMFDGEHQRIKNYLNEVTGSKSFNIIIIRDDISHVYEIGHALNRNELVCIHADRFVNTAKTIIRPFLGSPAKFPLGPFSIASTFNVPVSFVYAFKESTTHYHLFGSKVMLREEQTPKREYAEQLADRFIKSFEEKVSRYPEQWFNYYNFWELN